MMSRGDSPLRRTSSSPTSNPARDAGDPGATATTRGADIEPRLRGAFDEGANRTGSAGDLMAVAQGLLAAPRACRGGAELSPLVETPADVAHLPAFDSPVALLAQTTLSHREWSDVLDATAERFPDMWRPGRSDLCFATTNRQSALTELAPRCDAVVVIGSANSSNTRALEKLAHESGCRRVLRINGPDELPDDLDGTVGVTAGASAPEELVNAVIARLAPVEGVEEVRITTEEEYFPPPRELRELLSAIDTIATFTLGGPVGTGPALNDRTTAASDVLAALH